ncbi:MAG: site-specific integrase [Campylobacterales bacterium]|nr:site-specific integrase [Campylobacterales bacterium]
MNLVKSKKFIGVYSYERKDKDISYYITYRDTNGKQFKQKIGEKSKGINENYCNQLRNQTINQLKLGELPPNVILRMKHKVVTLNSISDYYFKHHISKSKHKWENKYNLHIRDLIGKKDVELLDITDMELLQQSMIDKNLSNSTINNYFDIVSSICNFGLSKDIYKGKNPTKLIKKQKVDNIRERFLSKSEVSDLIECVKSNFTLHLFTKLSLSTGGRFSTILNIKKRDIDLENGIITLKDFKNETTYSGYISDNDLVELLQIRMNTIGNNDYLIREDGIKDIGRYISRKMSGIFYDLFNSDIDEEDKDYRKYKVVIHTLRHTVLSHLGINGVSPFEIKKISNHKSLLMVERYVKLNPNSGKDKIQNLF